MEQHGPTATLGESSRRRDEETACDATAWRRRLGSGLSLLVDPLIAPSFDRTGFRIHRLAFHEKDLDVDLSGRRCLVTGANSGIGFETALALAKRGAEVALLCRSPQRGLEAAASIRRRTGNAGVSFEHVDLADPGSIRDAAARLGDAPIDVLVHNAGVLPDERIETREGFELTLATHVIGPFLLTRLLRERLEASDDGRVVWVSSGGMYTRRLELDDPSWRQRAYDGVRAYAETKRAQVVLARMWADELRGAGVAVYAMHPGWADTPAVRSSLPRFHRLTRSILRTPAEGADTVVWLAASPRGGRHSGGFYFDRRPRTAHLLPWTRETEADRRALWRACERWIEAAPVPSASAAPPDRSGRHAPPRVAIGLGSGSAGRRRIGEATGPSLAAHASGGSRDEA